MHHQASMPNLSLNCSPFSLKFASFSIENLHLADGLWVVWSGYAMLDSILAQQGFKLIVAKVLPSIANNRSWCSKHCQDLL